MDGQTPIENIVVNLPAILAGLGALVGIVLSVLAYMSRESTKREEQQQRRDEKWEGRFDEQQKRHDAIAERWAERFASQDAQFQQMSAHWSSMYAKLSSKFDGLHVELVRELATKGDVENMNRKLDQKASSDELQRIEDKLDAKANRDEVNGLGSRVNDLSASVAKLEGHAGRSVPTASQIGRRHQ